MIYKKGKLYLELFIIWKSKKFILLIVSVIVERLKKRLHEYKKSYSRLQDKANKSLNFKILIKNLSKKAKVRS